MLLGGHDSSTFPTKDPAWNPVVHSQLTAVHSDFGGCGEQGDVGVVSEAHPAVHGVHAGAWVTLENISILLRSSIFHNCRGTKCSTLWMVHVHVHALNVVHFVPTPLEVWQADTLESGCLSFTTSHTCSMHYTCTWGKRQGKDIHA